MAINHTAKPSILGYTYQLFYGLYLLLHSEEDKKIFIEHYDDLTIENKGTYQVIQMKYSQTPKNITDRSIDLWKTIRNWSSNIMNKNPEFMNAELVIITTDHAVKNSIAYFLKPENKKIDDALKRLNEVGQNAGNEIENKFYPIFQKLGPIEQAKLLQRISILDGAPTFEEIEERVKYFLKKFTDIEFVEKYYTDVLGWWTKKIHEVLQTKELIGIDSSELWELLRNIRNTYRKEILITTIKESDVLSKSTSIDNKTFVKQLLIINKEPEDIKIAKIDYLMADSQTTKWINENPSLDDEIRKHKEALFEEWKLKFSSLKQKLKNNKDDNVLVSTGCDLYDWAMIDTYYLNIGPKAGHFFRRGKFHELSDEKRIGWHPDYEEELKKIKNV